MNVTFGLDGFLDDFWSHMLMEILVLTSFTDGNELFFLGGLKSSV